MNKIHVLLTLSCITFASCQVSKPVKDATSDYVVDPLKKASGAVTSTVSAGSIGTAVGTKNLAQKSAIATKLPANVYSREVTGENLRKRISLVEKSGWYYMGSRREYHYVAREFVDREIFRVKKDEFKIESPFKLTPKRSLWKQLPTKKIRHLND